MSGVAAQESARLCLAGLAATSPPRQDHFADISHGSGHALDPLPCGIGKRLPGENLPDMWLTSGTIRLALFFAFINHGFGIESFTITDDRFTLDGQPFQMYSGSIHYFRVPNEYWEDRLLRLKAMGLNTVQFYVPWNRHEPTPGTFEWTGDLDVARFLQLAHRVGLWVNIRPGPYICAEWDAGGIPWWLSSTKVAGSRDMKLRSSDPAFLRHVNRWWNVLLPKIAPFMRARGGPVLMVQVENEYGYCGSSKAYLKNLIAVARATLGQETVIFTTDPPYNVGKGSLAGDKVYTVVDFGPSVDAEQAFAVQRKMNPPGMSPPFCSEFYTGWLTHWGQAMANTSAQQMTDAFSKILAYANGTGSANLYMAHGGTNFGFWAGAGLSGSKFLPQITSYDYSAPISEQGRAGQPGIGGPNKFEMLRKAISDHTGREPSAWPEPLPTASFGRVKLSQTATLLEAVGKLFPGDGIPSQQPVNFEEYDQGHGAVLYSAEVDGERLRNGATLDLGQPVHDYAHVYMDGRLVDVLDRGHPRNVSLPAASAGKARLEVLVHAMGRDSGGCYFDLKGLNSPVKLSGQPVEGWRTFLLPLTDLGKVPFKEGGDMSAALGKSPADPTFFRGIFEISSSSRRRSTGHLPDTFLDLRQWGKGIVWVNGFNLGWYWPSIGPQNHYFVPGPRLREGANEVVLLEFERIHEDTAVRFVAEPDLRGPQKKEDVAELDRVAVSRR